jgi:hypothetical protein
LYIMFIQALFITAKTWKQLKCPLTDECMQNVSHTHIHNGISSAFGSIEMLPSM